MKRPVHLGISDDLDCALAALDPARGGRFLTVSAHGAGEAALALAAHGADEVVAVDLEAPDVLAQLIELKTTAFELLGREDALVVYGLRPASDLRRKALARQLARALPNNDMTRWAREGLAHADRIALFFKALMLAMRALGDADTIFRDPDPARRIDALRRAVSRTWLTTLTRALGERFFPEAELRASEYPRALARDPLAYLEALVRAGFLESPLFAPLVLGKDAVLPEAILPPHLRTPAYDDLRARVRRVRTSSVSARTDLPPGPFAGAYLSNAVDYLLPDERVHLFRALKQGSIEGAPILVYSNEAFAKVPLELGFALDEGASHQIASRDRAKIYGRVEVYRARATCERHLRVVEA